jgi:hypothetical protein
MIRGLLLILDSKSSWEKIAAAQRGFLFVLLVHLVPLMATTLGVEAYGMMRLGEARTSFTEEIIKVTQESALRFLVAAAALNLLAILAGSKLMQRVGGNFHLAWGYASCFKVLAYGLSPLFLLHLLDALPGINTWVCFAIGIAMSVALLYFGVPTILRPDPSKAMGVYMIISVLVVVLAGLAHFLAIQVLHNQINPRFWEQFTR